MARGTRRLSAGHLKHRIVIETFTTTSDGRGGTTEAWTTHATLWARVTPISSREAYQAGQLQGSITHRVISRYATGVQPKMRVKWGTRYFQITGSRDLNEDGLVLEMDCIEERV